MRVISVVEHPLCKISIFLWNQKYLIKIEHDMFEQTFKVHEYDVNGIDDLKARLTEDFIQKTVTRFREMHKDLALEFS